MPHGWLTRNEQQALRGLAAGHRVLEIGGWQGLSATVMGEHARQLVTVDHFRGDQWTQAVVGPKRQQDVLQAYLQAIHQAGLADRVMPMVADLHQALPCLDPSRFGLIFYDADHSPGPTRFALEWAWPGLAQRIHQRKPWSLAVHDYKPRNPKLTETNQAIDRWADQNGLQMLRVDSLAIFSHDPDGVDKP